MDGEAVLENIMIARTFTHEQMEDALLAIAGKMAEEPFKLLIVDSVMAHYRVDFTAAANFPVDNSVSDNSCPNSPNLPTSSTWPSCARTKFKVIQERWPLLGVEPKKPIGGHVLAHASTIRLWREKRKSRSARVKIMQGPDLKEQDAEFMISNGGVVDIE